MFRCKTVFEGDDYSWELSCLDTACLVKRTGSSTEKDKAAAMKGYYKRELIISAWWGISWRPVNTNEGFVVGVQRDILKGR